MLERDERVSDIPDAFFEIQQVKKVKKRYNFCPTCRLTYSPYFTHNCKIPDFHEKFAYKPADLQPME